MSSTSQILRAELEQGTSNSLGIKGKGGRGKKKKKEKKKKKGQSYKDVTSEGDNSHPPVIAPWSQWSPSVSKDGYDIRKKRESMRLAVWLLR